MLDDTSKLLAQIKNTSRIKELKRAKRVYYYKLIKKWVLRILLVSSTLLALTFPIEFGTIIGSWINDFFGTIIKNSIK